MKLSDRKWGEFRIINIFGNSINAKAYHFSDLEETNDIKNSIPYITRTNMNNGLFCLVKKEKYFKKNIKNTICFGAENATYFYQPYDYLTGNKMYYYVSNNLSKYSLLFIVSCLNKSIFNCGFGYGMGLTGSRSDTKKILLPTTPQGDPDYEFMENYIKELMSKKRQKYIEYVKEKMEDLKTVVGGEYVLNDREQREFRIGDLFDIEKCKCSNASILKKGNIPYIGATNKNNGVMNFVEKNLKLITKGNCIVFICDGQGSVGYSIYKKENFIGSTTLKIGRNKFLNMYNAKFIISVLDKNKSIYSFGYKRNECRLKKETILLPVMVDGTPDYEFMENYTKKLIYNKLLKYLEYTTKTTNN